MSEHEEYRLAPLKTSKFKTLPVPLTPIDEKNWVVQDEFRFASSWFGKTYRVPRGQITDFASIPRLLWFIYPRWGKYGFASILHDRLYRRKLRSVSRQEADRVFLEAMTDLGVPCPRRYVLYYAVRAFGWIGWKKHGALSSD